LGPISSADAETVSAQLERRLAPRSGRVRLLHHAGSVRVITVDDKGYGMTYLFGDGWVAVSTRSRTCFSCQPPPADGIPAGPHHATRGLSTAQRPHNPRWRYPSAPVSTGSSTIAVRAARTPQSGSSSAPRRARTACASRTNHPDCKENSDHAPHPTRNPWPTRRDHPRRRRRRLLRRPQRHQRQRRRLLQPAPLTAKDHAITDVPGLVKA
jgi:hypothetical protein